MLEYLAARARDLFPQDWPHFLGVSALGTILDAFWRHWTEFPLSNPVLVVTAFWGADWVAGSLVAYQAHLWRPDRAAKSVGKWVMWMITLAIAYEIRHSGLWGMGGVAGMIEAAIILSEASSVFRNMALLSPSGDQAKLLNRYADVTNSQSLKMPEKKKEDT